MDFKTTILEDTIVWGIRLTWEDRKRMMSSGVFSGVMMEVDPSAMIDLLVDCGCIITWDREDELTPQAIYSLPMHHLVQLAVRVGQYVAVGAVEGDDGGPLASQNKQPEKLTDCSPESD